eukprot:NODE_3561_length_877_cov_55.376000_g3539_i0.p1 GENE.NODE_3561_length_877_cov_55.376000_g3539_i0~~NODE_3561_length_877_cov_55.376000_g3539_i0.p1  ORF type:complete len:218 (-),score=18.15 NODE_3561_length_877_cov_55.376000_g3539_i0:119-772(-)
MSMSIPSVGDSVAALLRFAQWHVDCLSALAADQPFPKEAPYVPIPVVKTRPVRKRARVDSSPPISRKLQLGSSPTATVPMHVDAEVEKSLPPKTHQKSPPPKRLASPPRAECTAAPIPEPVKIKDPVKPVAVVKPQCKGVVKRPEWAEPAALHELLVKQRINPDDVFTPVKSCDLDAIFGQPYSKRKTPRTSSQNWELDTFSEADVQKYNQDMKYTV